MATRIAPRPKKKTAKKRGAGRALARKTERPPRPQRKRVPSRDQDFALYLYGMTVIPDDPFVVTSEAVDGLGIVEPFPCDDWICWVSRVNRTEFAERLQANMENLDWLAACSIRHQKVLAEIAQHVDVLPARFGTVFLTEESLAEDVRGREASIAATLEKIAGADEWGVKIFADARGRKQAAAAAPSSGADYLKQKAAAMHRAGVSKQDPEIDELASELERVSVTTAPGGKASSGQTNLVWSGSFLVRRSKRQHFEELLRRYARLWGDVRRIEVTGPWPPYSFVGSQA